MGQPSQLLTVDNECLAECNLSVVYSKTYEKLLTQLEASITADTTSISEVNSEEVFMLHSKAIRVFFKL